MAELTAAKVGDFVCVDRPYLPTLRYEVVNVTNSVVHGLCRDASGDWKCEFRRRDGLIKGRVRYKAFGYLEGGK
jgi:hypothetical protein